MYCTVQYNSSPTRPYPSVAGTGSQDQGKPPAVPIVRAYRHLSTVCSFGLFGNMMAFSNSCIHFSNDCVPHLVDPSRANGPKVPTSFSDSERRMQRDVYRHFCGDDVTFHHLSMSTEAVNGRKRGEVRKARSTKLNPRHFRSFFTVTHPTHITCTLVRER